MRWTNFLACHGKRETMSMGTRENQTPFLNNSVLSGSIADAPMNKLFKPFTKKKASLQERFIQYAERKNTISNAGNVS